MHALLARQDKKSSKLILCFASSSPSRSTHQYGWGEQVRLWLRLHGDDSTHGHDMRRHVNGIKNKNENTMNVCILISLSTPIIGVV